MVDNCIREYRVKRGWTQQQLADKVDGGKQVLEILVIPLSTSQSRWLTRSAYLTHVAYWRLQASRKKTLAKARCVP